MADPVEFIARLQRRGHLVSVARDAVIQRARELVEATGEASYGPKGDRDDYMTVLRCGEVYRLRMALEEYNRMQTWEPAKDDDG